MDNPDQVFGYTIGLQEVLWIKYGCKTIDDVIDGARERLKQTCLDIYLLLAPSKGFEYYWGDLLRFKEQGKAKTIGVCRFYVNQLQIIKNRYGVYPAINQIEVHPYYSNTKLINFCKEKGIAVEARSVFTHGEALGGLMKEKTLIKIANDCDKTVPQIIIRWIVQKGLIAIVKSETEQHIKDNIEVFDFYLTES